MIVIAFIGGRWIERPEREERIKLLKDKIRKLVELYKVGKATQHHLDMLESDKQELIKLQRVHLAEVNHLFFFYEYFSEARNSGNPDNLVPDARHDMDSAPEFHQKLSNILDSVSNYNKTANVCYSASRGHAKSAMLSNSFPTREFCYRKRSMVLIISETLPGSVKFLRWIANQLKHNEKLREDFGELLNPNSNQNTKDAQDQFITHTGAMLACSSLGKQIRGIRNGSQRPDLIILDDLESIEANNTGELRAKNKTWFNAEMFPARSVVDCATLFMGTMCHPDSLLNYVLTERTDFIRNKFPAIIDYPERMDLWDKFCDIFKNYAPSESELEAYETATTQMESPNERAAMDFYRAHRSEMDEGAKVLWETRFPLHKLMMEKVSIGSRAFSSEFLNDAVDAETAMFKPDENFTYYENGMDFMTDQFRIVGAVDMAMGKERGDFSAVTFIAEDKRTKKKYVIDNYCRRTQPDQFIKDIVGLVQKWQPEQLAVEAVAAQEFFATELQKALAAVGYPAYTRVKKVYSRSRKELRIESLLMPIEEGTLLFNRNHRELLDQFTKYGTKFFDDAIDSCEMAYSALKTSKASVSVKRSWM